MPEEDLTVEEFSHALFQAYFPIPHVAFMPEMISNLSAEARKEWDEFIQVSIELQAEMKTFIIPLAFDHKKEVYWVDYPHSYISHFKLNPEDMPEMVVVLKITDDLKYDPDTTICIQHSNITGPLREKVLEKFGKFPWFTWDGTEESLMYLHLME